MRFASKSIVGCVKKTAGAWKNACFTPSSKARSVSLLSKFFEAGKWHGRSTTLRAVINGIRRPPRHGAGRKAHLIQ